MSTSIDVDEAVMRFSLASRELFNNYFRVKNGYEKDGWLLEERFSDVQAQLFQKLVIEPAGLPSRKYGEANEGLLVLLRDASTAPMMANREIDGGYWDFPITAVTDEARLLFVRFFDWDQLGLRDNQYVRVRIDEWPSCLSAVGKHALIERRHVKFDRRIAQSNDPE